MKEKNKRWRCWLGIHKWGYCYAPFVLEGVTGRVQGKVCDRCGFKSPDGRFIPN